MLDPETLHDRWTDGTSGLPHREVRHLRAEFREYTGLEPPRAASDYNSWLTGDKEDEITKRLAEAADVDADVDVDIEDESPDDEYEAADVEEDGDAGE